MSRAGREGMCGCGCGCVVCVHVSSSISYDLGTWSQTHHPNVMELMEQFPLQASATTFVLICNSEGSGYRAAIGCDSQVRDGVVWRCGMAHCDVREVFLSLAGCGCCYACASEERLVGQLRLTRWENALFFFLFFFWFLSFLARRGPEGTHVKVQRCGTRREGDGARIREEVRERGIGGLGCRMQGIFDWGRGGERRECMILFLAYSRLVERSYLGRVHAVTMD